MEKEGVEVSKRGETCKSTSRLKRPEVIARVPRYRRAISRRLVAGDPLFRATHRIKKKRINVPPDRPP